MHAVSGITRGLFQTIFGRNGLTIGRNLGHSMPPGAERARLAIWEPGELAPVEERISVLEENVTGLNRRFDQTDVDLRDQLAASNAKLETEQAARAAADREISERLEATETGGLTLSLVGTIWIVVGINIGTSPGRLAIWCQ